MSIVVFSSVLNFVLLHSANWVRFKLSARRGCFSRPASRLPSSCSHRGKRTGRTPAAGPRTATMSRLQGSAPKYCGQCPTEVCGQKLVNARRSSITGEWLCAKCRSKGKQTTTRASGAPSPTPHPHIPASSTATAASSVAAPTPLSAAAPQIKPSASSKPASTAAAAAAAPLAAAAAFSTSPATSSPPVYLRNDPRAQTFLAEYGYIFLLADEESRPPQRCQRRGERIMQAHQE